MEQQTLTLRSEQGDAVELALEIFMTGQIDYRCCPDPIGQLIQDHDHVAWKSRQYAEFEQLLDQVDEKFYEYIDLIRTNYDPNFEI